MPSPLNRQLGTGSTALTRRIKSNWRTAGQRLVLPPTSSGTDNDVESQEVELGPCRAIARVQELRALPPVCSVAAPTDSGGT